MNHIELRINGVTHLIIRILRLILILHVALIDVVHFLFRFVLYIKYDYNFNMVD